MARPREFDEAVVLERVMQVFWAKGYEAASLDDLCASTGLGRSSLYAAFGGKRDLLHRSLDRYAEQGIARITAALAKPLPLREAISAFIGDLIDGIVAGPGRRGCFIGNCAAELARQDRSTAIRVRRSLERVEAVFAGALARAQMRGELAASADIRSVARFLVAGIQGLRLAGKANPERAYLEEIAAVMLRCLDK